MSLYECAICLENIKENNMYITDCCHKFCNECFLDLIKSCKEQQCDVKCPTCRTILEEFITPQEQTLVLLIENTINYDINFMYDELDEVDEDDENAQSDFEVEDEPERMVFYNVRVVNANVEDADDSDDDEANELYHIKRTRDLEEELYGENYTYY